MSSHQKYPEPTVGALIVNNKNEFLLLKSNKWNKDVYIIPGGHIELGESIVDAVKREVKEETNLDIYDIRFLCFQEYIYGDEFYKKRHYIFFDYSCKTNSTSVVLNHEAQEYKWVHIENAVNLPLETYTRNVIDKYLKTVSA